MSGQVTKKSTEAQQLQQQSSGQRAHDTETQERHASANASAGLNLNLFGALSGAFSSKSKKETRQNADGSSHVAETKHDKGAANAVASGQGQAYGSANAHEHNLRSKSKGIEQGASQSKAVSGKKQVDHLGIEG